MSALIGRASDFFILGPRVARGNGVLEAIHALYYLPENYQLVFASGNTADQAFYNEVVTLVEQNALGARVHFAQGQKSPHVIIAPRQMKAQDKRMVSGDSPEALASAILRAARQA
ncbi:MAG TPA: hypothetical protein VJ836_02025 [Candidatus Saccharimonadales bacterium]|nr:hypothetical protein [Candidatus Saccharimonadales bacterium]